MNTVLEELAKLHPAVAFGKVEAEAVPELSLKYTITAVPAFVFLQVRPRRHAPSALWLSPYC